VDVVSYCKNLGENNWLQSTQYTLSMLITVLFTYVYIRPTDQNCNSMCVYCQKRLLFYFILLITF